MQTRHGSKCGVRNAECGINRSASPTRAVFRIPNSAFRITALFLATLLLDRPLHAAPVVRVFQQQCQNGHCTQGWYSGVVIGRDAKTKELVVVTVAHGWLPGAKTLVEVEPGKFEAATVAGQSSSDDVSVLLVSHPERTEILPLGTAPPQKGQEVVVSGFQLGRKYFSRKARVKGYHGNWIRLNETVAQGESGGAITLDGELVGLIQGDTGPAAVMPGSGGQPGRFLSDGVAISLTVIRKWVKQSLGSIPEVPLQPTPQSEPLPAATNQVEESKGSKSASSEVPCDSSTVSTPPTSDHGNLASEVAESGKAELPRILSEHLGPVEARLQESLRQHGASLAKAPEDIKNAILPELPAIGWQVVADALPGVKSSVAAALPGVLPTVLSIAGAVGLPGAGGIALAGWLLSRAMGRHTHILSTIAGHLGAKPPAPDVNPPKPSPPTTGSADNGGSATRPVPSASAEIVNTSVAQVVTEVGTEAYQRMKGDLVRKNPTLASDGTIKLMDSLFTQHLSGLQTTK